MFIEQQVIACVVVTDWMIVTQVWGCGGSSASQAQQQQRKWELKDTEKHKDRKVCMNSRNLLLLIVRSYLLATCQIVIACLCVFCSSKLRTGRTTPTG
jgi:hypothetical protein